MKRKGEDRPALAIRFEDIPFDLPFKKEKVTSKIRQINKKTKRDIGESNCAFNFRNGKAKSVLIYLDVFNTRIQENMMNSESYKLCLRPVMLCFIAIYIRSNN